MKQTKEQWKTRIIKDIKEHNNVKLIILEINCENINKLQNEIILLSHKLKKYNELKELSQTAIENKIGKLATRKFLERWRKKHKKSVRHWLIIKPRTKKTQNIKLYGLIYTNDIEDIIQKWQYGKTLITDKINYNIINYMIELKIKHELTMLTSDHIGQ